MTVAPSSLLTAAGLPEWLSGPLEAHQGRHDLLHGVRADDPGARWVTWAELTEPGVLAAAHRRIAAADGAPAAAAAKWLAGWFAGSVADLVGFSYAAAHAGLLVDLAEIRWRLAPEGYPTRVDLGSAVAVVPVGHPWSGQPGTTTLPTDAEVTERTVGGLQEACRPVLDQVRTLARVGRTTLWAEIGDSLGLPVLHHRELPVDAAVVERLQALVRAPGAPWRRVPDLQVTAGPVPIYAGRKAGCCLSYRCAGAAGEAPETCGSCSLRELADCVARQTEWHAAG